MTILILSAFLNENAHQTIIFFTLLLQLILLYSYEMSKCSFTEKSPLDNQCIDGKVIYENYLLQSAIIMIIEIILLT